MHVARLKPGAKVFNREPRKIRILPGVALHSDFYAHR